MPVFSIDPSGVSINTPRMLQVNVQSESFESLSSINTSTIFNYNTDPQNHLAKPLNFTRKNLDLDFISTKLTDLNWDPIFSLNTYSIQNQITNSPPKPVSLKTFARILLPTNFTQTLVGHNGTISLSISGISSPTNMNFSLLNNTDSNYYSSSLFIENSGNMTATISLPSGININRLVSYQFLPKPTFNIASSGSGIPNVDYSEAYEPPGSDSILVPIIPTKNIQTNSITMPLYSQSSLIAPSGLNKLLTNIFNLFGFDQQANTTDPLPCDPPPGIDPDAYFRVWDIETNQWSECDCWEYKPSLADIRTKDKMLNEISHLANQGTFIYAKYIDELYKVQALEDLYDEFLDTFQPTLDTAEFLYLLVVRGYIDDAKKRAKKYQKEHEAKVSELQALIYKNRHLLQDYTVRTCEPQLPEPTPCTSDADCCHLVFVTDNSSHGPVIAAPSGYNTYYDEIQAWNVVYKPSDCDAENEVVSVQHQNSIQYYEASLEFWHCCNGGCQSEPCGPCCPSGNVPNYVVPYRLVDAGDGTKRCCGVGFIFDGIECVSENEFSEAGHPAIIPGPEYCPEAP